LFHRIRRCSSGGTTSPSSGARISGPEEGDASEIRVFAGAPENVLSFGPCQEKLGQPGEAAYQIAAVHAFRDEADLAFEWLERAYNQRDGGLPDIKGDRPMHGLVDDPRYKAFLRKLKLPE
jgi:hypothetical protein